MRDCRSSSMASVPADYSAWSPRLAIHASCRLGSSFCSDRLYLPMRWEKSAKAARGTDMPPVVCLGSKSTLRLGACATVLALTTPAIARRSQVSQRAVSTEKQTLAEGRESFDSNCAGCHGLDGRGGERGPDISTRAQVVQAPDQELRDILRTRRIVAGMQSFASLGVERLDA